MVHESLTQFAKQKDFLICVDSDGCAMDTMTSKHRQAFCPCFIRVYGLEAHAPLITEEWMRINLYSATRGINRFKGLAKILDFLAGNGVEIQGRKEIASWACAAPILSNDALKDAIAAGGGAALETALQWSYAVNETIAGMGDDARPFPGCKEALAAVSAQADMAVVSAANSEAVVEEWNRCALAPHMNLLLGQDAGSKAHCLTVLAGKGYTFGHALMVGDALGDLDAARQAGTLFFPILVGHEAESWNRLASEAFPRLLDGDFAGDYQEALLAELWDILR